MRIVIDMQGAQTESRYRGIGKYTLSFVRAIIKNAPNDDIILVLNSMLKDTIIPIFDEFKSLIPVSNIRVCYLLGPVKRLEDGNDLHRAISEKLRQAFIRSLNPDVIHITSFFEGYVDDALVSLKFSNCNIPLSLVFFDIIPLLNPRHYLDQDPKYKKFYLEKIACVSEASVLFAISEFSRREAINYLGFDEKQVINISAGLDNRFLGMPYNPESNLIVKKYSINSSFIMYVGGADGRKNLDMLVKAYSLLSDELKQKYKLVFVGRMPYIVVELLKKVAADHNINANSFIFTGYVPDQDLINLYRECDLFVFPSWHEGFGFPALEAMALGATVVASNNTSMCEIINNPEALFNPFDVYSISLKMKEVLDSPVLQEKLRKHGVTQSKNFSWDEVAIKALVAWRDIVAKRSKKNDLPINLAALQKDIASYFEFYDDQSLMIISECISKNHPDNVS